MMRRSTLLAVFLRSLTVQVSFNFWRMQNLGVAFAMVPVIRLQGDPKRRAELAAGHLQMFNTHPYMVTPVAGAVARLEEEGNGSEAAGLKKALMAPYAAIGDSFFWGALRSFSAVAALIASRAGFWPALLTFLILYSPAHLWVRTRGFREGYLRGKNSIDFIRELALPALSGRIRLFTLILIAVFTALALDAASRSWAFLPPGVALAMAMAAFVLCFFAIRRGISAVKILYGAGLLCMVLSI
jgi:PTS system mannose-specific IID component